MLTFSVALYPQTMTKEREMLELISQYVRIRNGAEGGAESSESLDAIASAFSEAMGRVDEVAAEDNIPPVVTRSEEEQMRHEEIEKSHNYMPPNWAD